LGGYVFGRNALLAIRTPLRILMDLSLAMRTRDGRLVII
jgi:hypothetical protein